MASPPLVSGFAILRNVTDSVDLYDKNADTGPGTSPASLVKFATALILARRKSGSMTDVVTVVAGDLVAGTTAQLQTNDNLDWTNLLHGLFLPSGNDAAETIARVIGNEIFVENGSTGSDVRTRFIEAMNSLAVELDLTNTLFRSPNGFPTTTDSATARDMNNLMIMALSHSIVGSVANVPTYTMQITGANSRTYVVSHTSWFAHYPSHFRGSKGGSTGSNTGHHISFQYLTDGGALLAGTVMRSPRAGDRFMDGWAMIFQALQEFSSLTSNAVLSGDPHFANVQVLAGFDGSVVDESGTGRTLTANGGAAAAVDTPMIHSGYLVLDGTGDFVEAADADDLSPHNNDFCVEAYVAGSGYVEQGLTAFVSKWDTTGNQREWSLQYDNSGDRLVLFISEDGSNFPLASWDFNDLDVFPASFFNGGIRHIAGRKSGTEIAVYLNGRKGLLMDDVGSLFSGSARFMIGARDAGASAEFLHTGRMDEVRVTIGNARYTSEWFTPTGRQFARSTSDTGSSGGGGGGGPGGVADGSFIRFFPGPALRFFPAPRLRTFPRP